MTVSTQTASITAHGDGVNTAFAYDFLIPYQADGSTPAVSAYLTSSLGVISQLTLNSDYSITGVGVELGGVVTYPITGSALPVGNFITILRALEYVQDTVLEDQGFRASSAEEMGDTIEMQVQQLRMLGLSALRVPLGSEVDAFPSALERANTLAGFDAGGAAALYDLSPAASAGDASTLAYTPGIPGAVVRTVQGRLRDWTSVKDEGVLGNGSFDDTALFQAALATGYSLNLPAGTYVTTANLLLNTTAQQGQIVRGTGRTTTLGAGTGRTIIKPSAAVTAVFSTTGAGFGGYLQGEGFEDMTLDMTSMGDTSASVGLLFARSFDGHVRNVSIIGDGVNKRGLKFLAGAYDTNVSKVSAKLVEVLGTNAGDRATTLTFDTCDLGGVLIDWALSVNFVGGSIQGVYNASNVIYLAPGTTPYNYAYNSAGLYAAVIAKVDNAVLTTFAGVDFEALGSFPATFNDGSHGVLPLVPVVYNTANAVGTIFPGSPFNACYLLNLGARTEAGPFSANAANYSNIQCPTILIGPTADQSIPNGVATKVDFKQGGGTVSQVDDNYFLWDATNKRLVVLVAGCYDIYALVQFDGADFTGKFLYLNAAFTTLGINRNGNNNPVAGGAGVVGAEFKLKVNLAAGEIITITVFQNSGGALDTTGSPAYTYLNVAKVPG